MKFEYQSVTVDDGATLRYVDFGSGKPLVYLIGFGETVSSSSGLLSRWSEKFRCVSFDHRGYGETPATDVVGMERSARDLHCLLEELDLRDVRLVGYSMGGSVAFAYAQLFGMDRVSRLVLADTTPKLINEGDWTLGLWQGRYSRDDFERDLDLITTDSTACHLSFYLRAATQSPIESPPEFPEGYDKEEWLARVVEHTGIRERLARRVFFIDRKPEFCELEKKYWNSMTGEDRVDVTKSVKVPTLCVYANPGSFYSPRTGAWLAETLPHGSLKVIENATHVFPKEHFDEFITVVEEFFST